MPPPSTVAWFQALRIRQWTKNLVIPAVALFAWGDAAQGLRGKPLLVLFLAAYAFLLFSLLSSAIYILNDLRDRAADRLHPQKRLRPFASGTLSPRAGYAASLLLLLAVLLLSLPLLPARPDFPACLLAYLLLQAAYTLLLKRLPLLDVSCIALGFVLRAAAGACILPARISPWLLACTFLLALFLALCKRRHEKLLLGSGALNHRQALARYSPLGLDLLVMASAAATALCYGAYTLLPETRARFGSNLLWLTLPCVLLGLARYLFLVYRNEGGGSPERVLLTDPLMITTMFLYAFAALAAFLL